jgi:hypothetical protein
MPPTLGTLLTILPRNTFAHFRPSVTEYSLPFRQQAIFFFSPHTGLHRIVF